MGSDQVLSGYTVGITADRRSEDQAVLFRRLGADVIQGPTMRTLAVADEESLRGITLDLIARPPDYLVANTGLGIRTWFAAAADWELEERLRQALSEATILARGPKAAGALTSAKLKIAWRSPSEQLSEVATHLTSEGVEGKRIAFQLHGDDREPVTTALEAAGAQVIQVPVYRWILPSGSQSGEAQRLIRLCCEGKVDAVTFTAGPQVRQMFELAEADGLGSQLMDAFNERKPLAACIGPVCAGVAVEEGIRDPVWPDSWRLGSLVKLVAATLTGTAS
ncbi:MAG TPA: uroporphyrinogen-III synthase [Acidimicrobiales bacterium]|nr:uroporphyrinogen-III synthase [Acidimicrobiales bacterium]